jgi:4-amino-4-deoxy-L-arabinose transferase-like glycosyltransferase
MPTPPNSKLPRYALAAILALGAALRLSALSQESLWADEFYTLLCARAPGFVGAASISMDHGHLPPYFMLMHAVVRAFGESDAMLRLPSALVGALAPLFLYLAAASFFPGRPRLALWAALFMALSPMALWYAQEARPYSLVLTLEAFALWLFARGLREGPDGAAPPSLYWLGAGAFTTLLAMMTHLFASFFWAGCAAALIWLFWRRPKDRLRLLLPLSVMPAGIFPVIHAALGFSRRTHLDFLPERYDISLLQSVFMAQTLGPHWSPLAPSPRSLAIAFGAAVVAIGCWSLRGERRASPAAAFIGFGFAFTLAAPVFISFVVPIVYHGQRYLIVALPFTVLLLALAADGPGRRGRWGAALAVALLALQASYLFNYYAHRQKHTWDLAAEHIASRAGVETAVYVLQPRSAGLLDRYLDPPRTVHGLDLNPVALAEAIAIERRPIYFVSYIDPRPYLTMAGAPEPEEVGLMETHQPGQELWIVRLPTPDRK